MQKGLEIEIEIEKIPNSRSILIPVASQTIETIFAGDVKTIKCGGNIFEVYDYFVYEKDDFPPSSLLRLSLGKDVEPDRIWDKYPSSNTIYLFVCEEILSQEEVWGEGFELND